MRLQHGFLVGIVAFLMSSFALSDGSALSACNAHGPSLPIYGILTNDSPDRQLMSCKADAEGLVVGEWNIRDCFGGTCMQDVGTGVKLNRLRVIDNHPYENVDCFLYGRLADGSQVASATISSSGTGDQNIANGLTLIPGWLTHARITLQCNVPGVYNGARSGIHGLHVTPVKNQ